MKKFIFSIIFIIIAINTNSLIAQNSNHLISFKIDSLKINNNETKIILDNLIENETNCDYYTDSLVFGIEITEYNHDTVYFIISSNLSKTTFIDISLSGFFIYRGFLFFVSDKLETNIFQKSNKNKVFKKLKKGLPKKSGHSTIIPFYEDDRFTTNIYLYCEGTFIFDSGYPPCPRE